MGQTKARPTWIDVGLFALAYLVCAEAGHALSFHTAHDAFATVWPPSGLYLAALLLFRGRPEPRILLGALASNLLSDVLLHDQSVPISLGYWLANTLEAVCAARFLLWWSNGPVRMSRLADVLRLIATGILASACVGAPIGAATVYGFRGGAIVEHWATWWSADIVGILIVAPTVLAWTARRPQSLRNIGPVRFVEFLLLLAGQSAALTYVIHSKIDAGIPKRYIVLPFLIWGVLRFGPRGVTIGLSLLVCQMAAFTVNGLGAIAQSGASVNRQLLDLQLMSCVILISFLTVSAVIAERVGTSRDLTRKQSLLQAIHRAQTEFIGEAPLNVVFCSLLKDLMNLTESRRGYIAEVLPADVGAACPEARIIASLSWDDDLQKLSECSDPSLFETRNLKTIVESVLATGRPVAGSDLAMDDHDHRSIAGPPPLQSWLGMPLHYGDRLIGIVGIANRQNGFPEAFDEFLKPLLATCAHLMEMHRQKSARGCIEEELRKSQARLVAAQARAKLGNWEYDGRTKVSFWSPEVYRLLYRNPGPKLPGFDETLTLIHPDDRAEMLRTMEEVVKNGGSLTQEYRTNPINGPMRYLTTTIERVELREDGTSILAGIVQDVTERREAINAIQRSERELADFFEHANMGLQWVGLDGRVLRANPAMLDMLGYDRNEYVGEHIARFHVDVHEAYEFLERIEQGEELENFEAHLRCKDGTGRDVLISSSVFREEGRIRHARCFLRDVSELRRLEQQFYQAQKMDAIGRLAGGVAHDFNNLLTVMNGYAHLLHDGLPAGDPRRALVDEISNAGERAAALTRQLLTFSRQQVVRMRVFDLNDEVRGMQALLARLIGENIALSSDLDAAPLLVRADRGQLDQVLLNLVINARDAMPQGGNLELRTRRGFFPDETRAEDATLDAGPCAVLEVTDSGCGMDKATLARIFEPFFTTKPTGQGTGLGLATVYGIVKQTGGHVSVDSQPGEGSTFRVFLPCLEASSDDDPTVDDPIEIPRTFSEAGRKN